MQTDAERIKELEQLLKIEKSKSNKYEENGVAKLYYSLNRKAWEMADLMNGKNLKDLDIADPKDKTFDRLKIIWQDAASIATAVKTLGETAGITGDEVKDLKMNRNLTPENISDVLGNPAGQRS